MFFFKVILFVFSRPIVESLVVTELKDSFNWSLKRFAIDSLKIQCISNGEVKRGFQGLYEFQSYARKYLLPDYRVWCKRDISDYLDDWLEPNSKLLKVLDILSFSKYAEFDASDFLHWVECGKCLQVEVAVTRLLGVKAYKTGFKDTTMLMLLDYKLGCYSFYGFKRTKHEELNYIKQTLNQGVTL
jgi:hypothetical protein